MKKEMKMLAIVPAAFALALCLASCEQKIPADYSFKTLYGTYNWYRAQYYDPGMYDQESAVNAYLKHMPTTPVYGKMSEAQLEKFNDELKGFAKNNLEERYDEDTFSGLATIDDEGNFIVRFLSIKQDLDGNWTYLAREY